LIRLNDWFDCLPREMSAAYFTGDCLPREMGPGSISELETQLINSHHLEYISQYQITNHIHID